MKARKHEKKIKFRAFMLSCFRGFIYGIGFLPLQRLTFKAQSLLYEKFVYGGFGYADLRISV
jgi:hypothetical protein